jgi:hypothetical protein
MYLLQSSNGCQLQSFLHQKLIFIVVYMQVLPPDFNEFIWNGDFDYLYLSNDNGQIARTTIDYQAAETLTTKLIDGWEDFCTTSGYQAGDVLRFKFFDGKLSNFVHVFKNNA